MGNILAILIIGVPIILLFYFDNKVRKKNFNRGNNIWQNLINENNNLGFKKRIILLDFFPQNFQYREVSYSRQSLYKWIDGIWINYHDKLIKFRYKTNKESFWDKNIAGSDMNENYLIIPFQDLYDVRMDSIGISKTKGFGFGDTITLFGASTTEHLKSITIQIITKDTNGGVKTVELVLCDNFVTVKRGSIHANAYEKCATAILNEISYIIDNFN